MSRAFLTVVLFAAAACSGETLASAPDQPAATPPVADGPATEDELLLVRNDRNRNALSGGATTVFDITGEAFGHAAPNLSATSLAEARCRRRRLRGGRLRPARSAPYSTTNRARPVTLRDGRGRPPMEGEAFSSMLFRASVAGAMRSGRRSNPRGAEAPAPVPGFGSQLQMRAVDGSMPEITATVTYVDSAGMFADGTIVHAAVSAVYAHRASTQHSPRR